MNQENIQVELTNNEIDINDIVNKCKDPKSGGMCMYIGTTRNFYEDEAGKKRCCNLIVRG